MKLTTHEIGTAMALQQLAQEASEKARYFAALKPSDTNPRGPVHIRNAKHHQRRAAYFYARARWCMCLELETNHYFGE